MKTPEGAFIIAAVARPPSPEKPSPMYPPATVEMICPKAASPINIQARTLTPDSLQKALCALLNPTCVLRLSRFMAHPPYVLSTNLPGVVKWDSYGPAVRMMIC
jgi:hypothetical protein